MNLNCLLKIKSIAIGLIIFPMSLAFAQQPIDTIIKDPAKYAVSQATSADGIPTCGASSWYLLWRYFDLKNVVTPEKTDPKCRTWYCPMANPSYLDDNIRYPNKLTTTSSIYRYISKNQYDCAAWGPTINTLEYAAEKLKYENGQTVFRHTDSYSTRVRSKKAIMSDTRLTPAQREAEYQKTLDIKFDQLLFMQENYLEHDAPVIVHLDRDDTNGHYIVIVGIKDIDLYYMNPDVANYVDSNPNDGVDDRDYNGECLSEVNGNCLLMKTDWGTFIEEDWYQRTSKAKDGFWDATWVSFRP